MRGEPLGADLRLHHEHAMAGPSTRFALRDRAQDERIHAPSKRDRKQMRALFAPASLTV
jgi:hypothetical protein